MYQISDKTDNFDFLGPNLSKNGFWCQHFKNLSLNLKSTSLRYYVCQFSDKTDNFEYLGPNLAKTEFWSQNSKNLSLDSESASLRYYVHQFSDKANNFEFLGPNLAKNGFWGQNFKNLILDLKSTPPLYHVSIFSQNGQHLFFRPKFEEIAQLRAIFWFKYCWGCCRELGGGWNELGGGGWRWMEVGAQFSNTLWWHN